MTRRSAYSFALIVLLGVCLNATASDLPFQTRVAQQRLTREAVGIAERCVVKIDTVGGTQPFVQRNRPVDADEDGTPDEPINPFRDTLGSRFLVADGPTTGVIYDTDGWILASSFNFVLEPSYITVSLSDGREFVADLVAKDAVRKLALLKIDATGLETPTWVPSTDIQVGATAIALGRGFGGQSSSVTVGIVSALNRMMGNAIQTDANLSPANYGGPLIDVNGRFLGICVPMAQRQGELAGVEFYDAGIGFAVPKNRIDEIVDQLRTRGSIYRGWLGISVDVRSNDGLRIRAVGDPSPAHSLGIRAGDVIIQANGMEVRNFQHLRQAIYMVPAGEIVQVVIRRGELEYGYEVVLGRDEELGPLAQDEVPRVDPDNLFPMPKNALWP